MKINQTHQISEIYGPRGTRKALPQEAKTSAKDKLEISQTAKHYQMALRAAKNSPDIRAEKVDQIKAQTESGTYNISAEEVAKKMVASFLDHSI